MEIIGSMIFIGLAFLSTISLVISLFQFGKTDKTLPYFEARLKSSRRGFIFMFFAFLFLEALIWLIKPSDIVTFIICLSGYSLILLFGYGVAYLQLKFLSRSRHFQSISDLFNGGDRKKN